MRTIEISDETYEKIKVQLAEDEKIDISCYDDLVGKCFFFRTVTYHAVAKVVKRFGSFLQVDAMNTCNQCQKEMLLKMPRQFKLTEKSCVRVCDNPACPNFGLLQVSSEVMAEKLKEKPNQLNTQ